MPGGSWVLWRLSRGFHNGSVGSGMRRSMELRRLENRGSPLLQMAGDPNTQKEGGGVFCRLNYVLPQTLIKPKTAATKPLPGLCLSTFCGIWHARGLEAASTSTTAMLSKVNAMVLIKEIGTRLWRADCFPCCCGCMP